MRLAISRLDQWVAFLGFVSSVRRTTSSTLSSVTFLGAPVPTVLLDKNRRASLHEPPEIPVRGAARGFLLVGVVAVAAAVLLFLFTTLGGDADGVAVGERREEPAGGQAELPVLQRALTDRRNAESLLVSTVNGTVYRVDVGE